MSILDFTHACKAVDQAELVISEARFDGVNFGHWYIAFTRNGMPPMRLLWEARDAWLILQIHRSDGTWEDDVVIREPQQDTLTTLLSRLRN